MIFESDLYNSREICFTPSGKSPIFFYGRHVLSKDIHLNDDKNEEICGRYSAYVTTKGRLILVKEEGCVEWNDNFEPTFYVNFRKVMPCDSEEDIWTFDHKKGQPDDTYVEFVKEIGKELMKDKFFFFEDLTESPVPF